VRWRRKSNAGGCGRREDDGDDGDDGDDALALQIIGRARARETALTKSKSTTTTTTKKKKAFPSLPSSFDGRVRE